MTTQTLVLSPDEEVTWISIPMFVEITESPNISVCFCIQSLTTESRWARSNVYSLHDVVKFPIHPSYHHCFCITFRQRHVLRIPQIHKHSWIGPLLSLLQKIEENHASGVPLLHHSSSVYAPNNSLLAAPTFDSTACSLWKQILYVHVRLTKNLLSQIFTPTDDCSADTELLCTVNCAKQQLCISRFRSEVSRTSSVFPLQDPSI